MSKPKFSTHGKEWTMFSPTQSMYEIASNIPQIDLFMLNAEKVGLTEFMKGDEKYTVFIPENNFYYEMGKEAIDKLFTNANILHFFLNNHFVKGEHPVGNLKESITLTSLQGYPIHLEVKHKKIKINDAIMLCDQDIQARNGVIHVVNRFIVPSVEELQTTLLNII